MRAALLLGLLILFQTHLGDLGLPPQPDLDLPIVLGHYDPSNPPPAPPPPPPPPSPKRPTDDPRDEPLPVFFGEEIESSNDTIYYVIDCSISMSRYGRLERAQAELIRSIQGLSPNMRFNVIAYSCSLHSWSPGLRQATPDAKAGAIQWTYGLKADGGTGTGPAVALALSDRDCMAVALLTDGGPTCGMEFEEHRIMIRNANHQHAPVNVFGIDARRRYRDFCLAVAQDSGGTYVDVP